MRVQLGLEQAGDYQTASNPEKASGVYKPGESREWNPGLPAFEIRTTSPLALDNLLFGAP